MKVLGFRSMYLEYAERDVPILNFTWKSTVQYSKITKI